MSEKYKIGDLVWAKMATYPYWPAQVCQPNTPDETKNNCLWIYFFGSNNYAWIDEQRLKFYHEYKPKLTPNSKGAKLRKAVKEIDDYIEKKAADPEYEINKPSFVEDDQNDAMVTPKKSPKKRASKDSPPSSPLDQIVVSPPPKKQRRNKLKTDENGSEFGVENASPPDGINNELVALQPPIPNVAPAVQEKPSTSVKDPSSLVFGFLGMGMMATCIVKNLISAGHRLNLWNRTLEKCELIKQQNPGGMVNVYTTPCDVVLYSDIIICCVADSYAAGKILFGNLGVLSVDHALRGKGYIEMTGVDPETSKNFAKEITKMGGQYLEVQLHGGKEDADQSNMLVIAAGDKSLYDKCHSCFMAMGRNSFYLGQVGGATNMSLVLNLIGCVTMLGFAEGLSLAEKAGLTIQNVLEVFNATSHKSNYMYSKGNRIMHNFYDNPDHAIQHSQKDIKMCLDLSNKLKQPLLMGSASNELFKYAMRTGFDGQDCACVFVKSKF